MESIRELKIHHLTHIENFKKILKDKKILSRNELSRNMSDNIPVNTANMEIINRRGALNDYIPFHLNVLQEREGISYNYVVCKNHHEDSMIFLIFDEELLNKNTLFSVYHPASNYNNNRNHSYYGKLNYFKLSLEHFKKEIQTNYYRLFENISNTDDPNKRKQFLMSEVLMYKEVDIKFLKEIYVSDYSAKEDVEKILEQENLDIPVTVNDKFFSSKMSFLF